MKRLIYASLIIAALALVAWLGYTFRYRTSETETGGASDEFPGGSRGGGLPDAGRSPEGGASGANEIGTGPGADVALPFVTKFRKVSDLNIAAFRALTDGSILLFQTDGQIKKIASGGAGVSGGTAGVGGGAGGTGNKEETLSAAPVPDMIDASFSADGTKALITTATEAGERSSVFDVASRTWQVLPSDAVHPSWSPSGRTILYASFQGGTANIVSFDQGNARAKPQILLSLAAQDVVPQWITASAIAITEKPSARVGGSALLFSISKKTLTSIADDERGVLGIWNASGTRSLVFTARSNSAGGALSLRDGAWQNAMALSFLTLPVKCAFGALPLRTAETAENATSAAKTAPAPEQYLFCGIPREAKAMATAELPDAYLKRSLFTSDNLYAIKLATGEIELLRGEANEEFDIVNPSLARGTLYFINRFENALYALSLE